MAELVVIIFYIFCIIGCLYVLAEINRQEKLKLYSIRLEAYKTLRDIFDSIYETGKVIENHELAKLSRTARFIFGKDISRFVGNFNKEYSKSKSYYNHEQFDKRFIKYFKI